MPKFAAAVALFLGSVGAAAGATNSSSSDGGEASSKTAAVKLNAAEGSSQAVQELSPAGGDVVVPSSRREEQLKWGTLNDLCAELDLAGENFMDEALKRQQYPLSTRGAEGEHCSLGQEDYKNDGRPTVKRNVTALAHVMAAMPAVCDCGAEFKFAWPSSYLDVKVTDNPQITQTEEPYGIHHRYGQYASFPTIFLRPWRRRRPPASPGEKL